MADVSLAMAPVARARVRRRSSGSGSTPGGYLLVTAHRAGNVDDPSALGAAGGDPAALPLPAVFPVHPRTRARLEEAGALERLERRRRA